MVLNMDLLFNGNYGLLKSVVFKYGPNEYFGVECPGFKEAGICNVKNSIIQIDGVESEIYTVALPRVDIDKYEYLYCHSILTYEYYSLNKEWFDSYISKLYKIIIDNHDMSNISIASINKNIGGDNCKLCNRFIQYANSNMSDNSFVCYGCRETRKYLITNGAVYVG